MPVSAADLITPAMACLRVSILGAPPGAPTGEELQTLVAKIINAFLESRWEWPRHFEQMNPYAFVLTDPRSEKMDKRALRALAGELQLKLFGAEGEGEVSLLMFEGAEVEVHRFANLTVDAVDRMLDGEPMDPPFAGALDRITAPKEEAAPPPPEAPAEAFDDLDVAPATASSRPAAESEALEPPAPERAQPARPPIQLESCYFGLYLAASKSFIGSVALCRRPRTDRRLIPDLASREPLPGVAAEAFDAGCIDAVLKALDMDAPGQLFAPLSFSSLVKPAGRRAYARFLCHLPIEDRHRLGAAVYDTPRDPNFFTLRNIRRFLDPFFGEMNLLITDPAFEVEKLAPGMVSGVTLMLAEREPVNRSAAIRRFAGNRDAYRKRRIWSGVSPLTFQDEVDLCVALQVPVIAGPAISALAPRPVGVRGRRSRAASAA